MVETEEYVIDLSKPKCPVCGRLRQRDLKNAKEKCVNPECQIMDIVFNIPFVSTVPKLQKTVDRARRHGQNKLTRR